MENLAYNRIINKHITSGGKFMYCIIKKNRIVKRFNNLEKAHAYAVSHAAAIKKLENVRIIQTIQKIMQARIGHHDRVPAQCRHLQEWFSGAVAPSAVIQRRNRDDIFLRQQLLFHYLKQHLFCQFHLRNMPPLCLYP